MSLTGYCLVSWINGFHIACVSQSQRMTGAGWQFCIRRWLCSHTTFHLLLLIVLRFTHIAPTPIGRPSAARLPHWEDNHEGHIVCQ